MSRSYCALYVDAGYLLSAAATRVTGTSLRGGITVDHGKLLDALDQQVTAESGLPLLRIQWYDAAPSHAPSHEQRLIGALPRVKLRLGRMAPDGTQKGVDLRLGLDIVNHARHGRVDRLYLITGDDDLTEAVDEAQNFGAQVAVLAVPDREGRALAVSRHLRQVADDVVLIDEPSLDAAVRRRDTPAQHVSHPTTPATSPASVAARIAAASSPDLSKPWSARSEPALQQAPVYSSRTGESSYVDSRFALDPEELQQAVDTVCRQVVASWKRTATDDDHARVRGAKPSIPSELDRALLLDLAARLDITFLDDHMRYALRTTFWKVFENA